MLYATWQLQANVGSLPQNLVAALERKLALVLFALFGECVHLDLSCSSIVKKYASKHFLDGK